MRTGTRGKRAARGAACEAVRPGCAVERLESRVLLSAHVGLSSKVSAALLRSLRAGPAAINPDSAALSQIAQTSGSLSIGGNFNVSQGIGSQSSGAIAIDPTNANRLFAVSNLGGTGLLASFSSDGGQTWTPRTLAGGADGLPVAASSPSCSWDQFGNLFVAYLQTSVSPTQVVVVRSIDGGQSFTLVNSFAGGDQPTVSTGPGSVGGTGSVWLTYPNTSNQIVATGATVTALNNVGAFGPVNVVPGGTGMDFGDIAIGPAGSVMVAFQNNTVGQGLSNIRVSVDPDGVGAAGFGSAVVATTTNVGGLDFLPAQARRGIDAEAGLAWDHTGGAHNGRLYLVYTQETTDESNDFDVMLRYSDNSGSTWSAPARVNDDATARSQFLPRIALDPTSGNLAVTWLDARNDAGNGGTGGGSGDSDGVANDEAQLWGATSTTGGASFDPNAQISLGASRAGAQSSGNDFGDYTGLAFYGGAYYPIWPDNSTALGGNPDLPNFDLATAKVLLASPAPANDNFASRIALAGTSASAMGTNANATKELTEPSHGGNAGGVSVWWTWTAPSSQSYAISTAGSNFDTLLGVYTGSAVGGLTLVAGNDNESSPSILTSRVAFNAVAGTTYQIAVDGSGGATGGIALSIAPALSVISGSVYVDRDTSGERDAGEPGLGGRTVFLDANSNGVIDTTTSTPSSTDVPKAIADLATFTSNLLVSGVAANIADVKVTLNLSHTWDADLTVYLISPTGTRVKLFEGVGGSGDDFSGTVLDDDAPTAIATGVAPFAGNFRPQESLSVLGGQNPNGTWKLEVSDTVASDTGTLTGWSLALTVGELSTRTDANGDYYFPPVPSGSYGVRHVAPAGYLRTSSADLLVETASLGQDCPGQDFAYFPTAFTGGNGNDAYALSTLNAGATERIQETLFASATVTYTIPKSVLATSALSFTGGGGDDVLTIDYANGGPVTPGGVFFDGGAHTIGDTLAFLATANASDDAVFSASSASINSTVTTFSNAQTISFDGRDGLDTVAVNGGAVTFPTSQHFSMLSIASGASALLAAGGTRTLYTRSLSLTGSARLDLGDNDLLIDYSGASPIGSWTGSAYSGVIGMLQSGRNGGSWSGAGLVTTQSLAVSIKLTTLAVAEAAQVRGLSGTQTALYGGETIDATTIIVKYTYTGDANLDGKINVDDYTRIDFNVALNTTGWYNGDFNYDGKINVDDYTLIDFDVPIQGAPFIR